MRTYWISGLIVIAVLACATWIAGPARQGAWIAAYEHVRNVTDLTGTPFETAIATQQPKLVLIGDSILNSAVDAEQLTHELGVPCYRFGIQGSASALWYLMLKQGVIASGHKPAYVVILFRDVYLTVPEWRTNSRYRGTLNYFDKDRDPLLVELAYDPPTNPVRDFLRHHWSLYQVRGEVRDRVERLLREQAIASILGSTEVEVDGAVDKAFADEAMDKALLTKAQESAGVPLDQLPYFEFDVQVAHSFLPHMIRLAQDAGIQLICVRSRTRRELPSVIATEGTPEVAKVLIPKYVEELRAYLDAHGVPLVDLSHEDRLGIEHYGAGDHFNPELGKPLFTTILAEKLRALNVH